MSAQPKLQPDHLQKLKTTLEDAPRNYDFLAEYVRELEHMPSRRGYLSPPCVPELKRRRVKSWYRPLYR